MTKKTDVRNGFLVNIVGRVVCTSKVVKIKKHRTFCKESSTSVLTADLLLTMLSNCEIEATLKDSDIEGILICI